MLIAAINNSTATVWSISLLGTGNGGGIFAFDGDGACNGNYGLPCGNGTGYEGPANTFGNIHTIVNLNDSGTVYFTGGLAPGAQTWFSLEGALTPQNITITPEPGTLVMFGSGIIGLAGMIRRKISL